MDQNRDAADDFNPFKDDPLFTPMEGAEYLRVKITTFNKWRREKRFPCVRICADARFRRSDLNKFAHDHLSWGWMKGMD